MGLRSRPSASTTGSGADIVTGVTASISVRGGFDFIAQIRPTSVATLLERTARHQGRRLAPPAAGVTLGPPSMRGHVPVPATPLIGRQREMVRLRDLLARPAVRLVA